MYFFYISCIKSSHTLKEAAVQGISFTCIEFIQDNWDIPFSDSILKQK